VDGHKPPFDKDAVLNKLFSYVGAGDYLCTGAVNRKWRGRYIKLCYNSNKDTSSCAATATKGRSKSCAQHMATQ
jgi:hypothetical protein